MVRLARAHSAPDFARALARFVAAQDPAGLEAAHQDQYRERFFSVSAQPHGVFLKGRLDVVAGQSLLVALDAMGQRPDESRTPGQASADALVMLAERVCAGTGGVPIDPAGFATPLGSRSSADHARRGPAAASCDGAVSHGAAAVRMSEAVPDGAGSSHLESGTTSRPHISLLVPAETFAQLLAHEQARHVAPSSGHDDLTRTGSGADSGPGDPAPAPVSVVRTRRQRIAPHWSPVAPATLEDGTPVAMSELARCLCDADITRIVMAADGQPLDVGRTRRLHTPAQRKAVIARDRQCVWNGCESPAARCEVHHTLWWHRDKGPTDIEHAALVCRHHHGEIHRADLSIERLPHPVGSDADAPMRHVFRDRSAVVVNTPPGYRAGTPPVVGTRPEPPQAGPQARWVGSSGPRTRSGTAPVLLRSSVRGVGLPLGGHPEGRGRCSP